MKTIEVSKKELHLAAYIKSHGAKLIDVNRTAFVFESEKEESEWRVSHVNSSDLRTDRELLQLKKFI